MSTHPQPVTRHTIEQALPIQHRAVSFRPGTANAEARTIEAVLSTGAKVYRAPYWYDEEGYYEVLQLSEESVRLGRVEAGVCPVLDMHDRWTQVGVVERVWFEEVEGQLALVGLLRFSRRSEVDGLWQDIVDGIRRGISVGYLVHRYLVEQGDGPDTWTAIDWELYEASSVSMPADFGAATRAANDDTPRPPEVAVQVRSDDAPTFPCQIERARAQEPKMSDRSNPTAGAGDQQQLAERTRITSIMQAATGLQVPDEMVRAAIMDGLSVDEARTRFRALHDERATAARAEDLVKAERERIVRIQRAAEGTKVSGDFVEALIADGRSTADALEAILAENKRVESGKRDAELDARAAATDSAPVHTGEHFERGADEQEKWLRGMQEWLLYRANPKRYKMTEGARMFRGASLMDCARMWLERRGVRHWGHSPHEVARAAVRRVVEGRYQQPIEQRGAFGVSLHTIGDFNELLGSTTEKVLLDAYNFVKSPWRQVVTEMMLTDLKEKKAVRFGDLPELQPVNEHGEYERGSLTESGEGIQIAKDGVIVGVSLEAIINDELGAFTRIPSMFGRAAALREADKFFSLIINGETLTMSDGVAVFHANHGNLIATAATPPDLDGLQLLRKTMRRQQGLQGNRRIGAVARYLFIPEQYELTLAQLLKTTDENTDDPANRTPTYMRHLDFWVSQDLEDHNTRSWYGFADPQELESIGYGTLAGEQAVFVDQREGFDIDGLEFKVRLWSALAWIDHRGAVKVSNPEA